MKPPPDRRVNTLNLLHSENIRDGEKQSSWSTTRSTHTHTHRLKGCSNTLHRRISRLKIPAASQTTSNNRELQNPALLHQRMASVWTCATLNYSNKTRAGGAFWHTQTQVNLTKHTQLSSDVTHQPGAINTAIHPLLIVILDFMGTLRFLTEQKPAPDELREIQSLIIRVCSRKSSIIPPESNHTHTHQTAQHCLNDAQTCWWGTHTHVVSQM